MLFREREGAINPKESAQEELKVTSLGRGAEDCLMGLFVS